MVKLKDCILNKGTYGANEPSIPYNEGDIRYIRISDIDENGNLKNDTIKTAKNIDEKYILNDNDFLFARTGSVGRTFLYKKSMGKSIYAGYLIKYILDTSKIYPEYLSAYCQTSKYWQWVKQQERPAVQSNINAEEYSSLTIPLPPLDKQKEIANIMKEANLLKEKLEKEADKLLSSIDEYLLRELGINLPKKETDLKNRISYTVKLSEIKGKRFDCEYHQSIYNDYQKALIQGKYKLTKIKELMNNIRIILQPSDEKVLYIEIGDIDIENAIINLKVVPLKDLPNNSKIYIEKGDLLISKVRPNRKAIAIYNGEDKAYCTSAFVVLRENGKYKKELLQYLLRTNILNALIVRNVTGSTYPTINDIDILNIEIPTRRLKFNKKL
nr:restriction endonuclease subunit S [Brachyspira aalborgi]